MTAKKPSKITMTQAAFDKEIQRVHAQGIEEGRLGAFAKGQEAAIAEMKVAQDDDKTFQIAQIFIGAPFNDGTLLVGAAFVGGKMATIVARLGDIRHLAHVALTEGRVRNGGKA